MPRERKPAKKGEIEPNEQEPCEQRSYYYDDAHGYEDFDPQEEAEDDEVIEKPTS